MRKLASYALNQCALYAVSSPKMLAAKLEVPLIKLEDIANRSDNYFVRSQKKSSGGIRWIEEPKKELQDIHGRVHKLLSRVELPDYVHSVRKGYSYITNAGEHLSNKEMVKLDVENFYSSINQIAVFSFFKEVMLCATDVCGLLAKLLTYKGHLPTGSKASPALSYFVYKKMFDEIFYMATSKGLKVTLYVDDIVVSGSGANRGVLNSVRSIISKHGLRSHKLRCFRARQIKIVTGVMLSSKGLRLPHDRHLRIKQGYTEFHQAKTAIEKIEVLKRLGSLVHEAAQIDSRFRPSAIQLDAKRKQLKRLIKTGS